MNNIYMPFKSKILDIIQHTDIEFTFRMEYKGEVKPGQFFEVSIPKFGEAPISISGIGSNYVDLTIRKVGTVTDIIHSFNKGDSLFLRGPYGNGFNIDDYKGREIIVAAGGSGLAPVKGIVDYFSNNSKEASSFKIMAGFKSPKDILFKADIEKWEKNLNVLITVDNAEENYKGEIGLITKFIPNLEIKNLSNCSVIIVGPPMMMKFTVAEFKKLGIEDKNIWVSYERKMCCGVGKCGHCRINSTYICLDGPVFKYEVAKNLFD